MLERRRGRRAAAGGRSLSVWNHRPTTGTDRRRTAGHGAGFLTRRRLQNTPHHTIHFISLLLCYLIHSYQHRFNSHSSGIAHYSLILMLCAEQIHILLTYLLTYLMWVNRFPSESNMTNSGVVAGRRQGAP